LLTAKHRKFRENEFGSAGVGDAINRKAQTEGVPCRRILVCPSRHHYGNVIRYWPDALQNKFLRLDIRMAKGFLRGLSKKKAGSFLTLPFFIKLYWKGGEAISKGKIWEGLNIRNKNTSL